MKVKYELENETIEEAYLKVINVLFGVNSITQLKFKDENKFNLKKDNVIIKC